MKLEDCTKAELLWVIRYIRDRHINGKHDLERALIDLEYHREKSVWRRRRNTPPLPPRKAGATAN